ncbi:S8 family serine peptidase [Vineibacter terrae]|uniref:S8 family serine peptidase n=1 Tax=Vineibacter terrae TaxID=2586908 RepID=UPI001C49879D|nr:S8 family serine peptidase [Vineibacter terrae]
MAEVLARDPTGLELRADPAALAPERLLVFEVRGAIGPFAAAVRNVPGLELIDEEELVGDDEDKAPVAYLMVPDVRALRELESLWRRWQAGRLVFGETPWRDVFALLRNLRPWGPVDRVQPGEINILAEEVFERDDDDGVKLEIELVYRANPVTGVVQENEVRAAVVAHGGRVISRARIDDISYHAMLVELPVRAVRAIIERSTDGIVGLEPVMHIRPQSIASTIEVADAEDPDGARPAGALGTPILALLDGVPIAAHALLAAHLVVDDLFGLEAAAPVADRVHGTAMASLIIHGDRNSPEPPLPRRIHVVPVMGAGDAFPDDRLIVDLIYTAVVAMRDGPQATSPGVLIVNVSLGNPRRPFHGQLSPWARLLDRLAYRFGLLFIVSAGNCLQPFGIPAYANSTTFEDAAADDRAAETLRALGDIVADRRLFSPAETVNGLTIGACNEDRVSAAERATARVNVDPYGEVRMANPSSAIGPGFALSVKPDILMPGGREHLRFVRNHFHIEVMPARATRSAGLKVAAPPQGGREDVDGFTNGSSAAAALASRTAHRIHDALEAAYGGTFLGLSHVQKAVLLKALIAHPARWPEEAAALIRATIGPPEGKYHLRQRDNIRRFLGFGCVEADDAVACAGDRATFWAAGTLERDKVAIVNVPVPIAMGGQARPHALFATLAWFTPTSPGRKSYRSVRLKLLEPREKEALRIRAHSNQPDGNQTNRGTVFTRCWSGNQAPVVSAGMVIPLAVQRDPDQGVPVDEPVPFGLAVTLTMPGVVEIYEQVRQRLAVGQRAQV